MKVFFVLVSGVFIGITSLCDVPTIWIWFRRRW